MRSAVRWFEAAVSGKLDRAGRDVALRRCISQGITRALGMSRLPAGLSAALGDSSIALSAWRIAPIKAAMPEISMEPAAQGPTEVDAPTRPAADELQPRRGTAGSRRQPDPGAIVSGGGGGGGSGGGGGGGSRVILEAVLAKPPAGLSAVSAAISTAASSPAAAVQSAIAQHIVAEPSGTADLVNEGVLASKGMPLASPPARSRSLAVSGQATGNKLSIKGALDAEPMPRRETSSAELLGTAVKATTTAQKNILPRARSASGTRAPSPTERAAAEAGFHAQVKPPIVSGESPVAAIGFATRAASYERALWRHDVVPRRAIHSGGNAAVGEAGVAVGPAYRAPRRDDGSQGHPTSSRVSSAAQASAGQGGQAGMMVSLRGDVVMDGRKMGRLVASGQASAASLPTLSGSAINLRAVPIFAGTVAPL